MENTNQGILRSAAGVVWRRQRVLWWFFVLNLAIIYLAQLSFSGRMAMLDYSLQSDRLVQGMDMGVLLELMAKPEIAGGSNIGSVVLSQLVWFVLALFLAGGILTAYAGDRRLSTGEFFQGCGAYFWRFVRLLVCMAIAMIPVFIIFSVWSAIGARVAPGANSDRTGILFSLGGMALLGLMFLVVRLWFDMAQVRAVVEDERAMRRTVFRALRQTCGNFGQLFWLFIRPLVLGWIVFAVAIWLWTRIPAQRFWITFVLWEFVILFCMGMRLWQRAGETIWYQRHRVVEPIPVAFMPEPVTEPVSVVDATAPSGESRAPVAESIPVGEPTSTANPPAAEDQPPAADSATSGTQT